MNEIKKCSISGISFIFEKVAYNRLSNYIDSLRRAYKTSSESDEIIADIEARIAELILSAQSDPSQVVCLPLIENIIAQLGSAEDIAGSEEQNSAEIPTTDTRIARRMFRDLENNKLGGVCAGLGKYFNIDPVWIRLAIFAPLILLPISNISYHLRWMDNLGGNLFLVMAAIYLVLWLVIPEAKSAREKLEMDGEQVTARAIADRHEATTDEQAAKSSIATFIAWFGKVAVVMLKLFVAMIVFVLVIICGALIAAMFATTMGLGGAVIELGNLGALADLISFI